MCIDDQLPTNDFLFPLNLYIASSVSSIISYPLRMYQYAWQCVLMISYLPVISQYHEVLVLPHSIKYHLISSQIESALLAVCIDDEVTPHQYQVSSCIILECFILILPIFRL